MPEGERGEGVSYSVPLAMGMDGRVGLRGKWRGGLSGDMQCEGLSGGLAMLRWEADGVRGRLRICLLRMRSMESSCEA